MSNETANIPPVLETAWKRFADYDNTAEYQQDQFYKMRRWVLYFSIAATFIAIIIERIRTVYLGFPNEIVTVLQVILIALPIAGSVIIAYLSEFKQGQKYLAMRTGAEEIKKEIYLYRTVMQAYPNRKKWLNNRVSEIQRQVHRSSGGEVVIRAYSGEQLNPIFNPDAKAPGDEGFKDLTAEEYITLRLDDQLAWHIRKIEAHQKKRQRFIMLILIIGGIGSLLAGIDFIFEGVAVWVAFAAAISSAITNWKELLGLDMIVANYSKVILELNILRDKWNSLEPHEKNQPEFYKVVRVTENLLWSQNTRFISAMRESMEDAEAEEKKIIEEMIEMSQEVVGKIQEEIVDEARVSMEAAASEVVTISGMPDEEDDEKLPEGAIFNVALGPAEAVNIGDDEKDAADGFDDEKLIDIEVDENELEERALDPIESAVSAAIQESNAVKSSLSTKNSNNHEITTSKPGKNNEDHAVETTDSQAEDEDTK